MLWCLPQVATAQTVTSSTSVPDHQQLLVQLEERLAQLKKRVFRSEARVSALKSTAFAGVEVRTKALLTHVNEMEEFVLSRARFFMDDGLLLEVDNTDGRLENVRSFEIFNGAVTPGRHEIRVELVFVGRTFGPFRYLDGYKFRLRSTYNLDVVKDRVSQLQIVSYERDFETDEAEKRLAVRYDVEVRSNAPAGPDQQP